MGKHLDTARQFFGCDTRGLLEGGRYALVHTRSLESDAEADPHFAGSRAGGDGEGMFARYLEKMTRDA
jgi:hypothetical protein